jgi:hypothetical protein
MFSQEKIKSILLYFKNKRWEQAVNRNKIMPSSNKPFISDSTLQTIARTQVKKISATTMIWPKSASYIQKKKNKTSVTDSVQCIAYNNKHFCRLISENSTSNAVLPVFYIDDMLNVIDARKQGGGVNEQYIQENLANDIDLQSFSNIGYYRGLPTELGTIVLIELPELLLDTYSMKQLQSIIKQYIASGITPIIRFYDSTEFEAA